MRKTLTLTAAAASLALAGCSSSGTTAAPAATSAPATIAAATTATTTAAPATAAPTTKGPVTATTVAQAITAAIHQAKRTAVYTDASDPNHLLGRPHQYTSKVEIRDSRIKAGIDPQQPPDGIQYGASVEVFENSEDAAARAASVEQNTGAQPDTMEYDYVHGDVLIRVSHFLTPAQAKAYDTVAQTFG